MAAPAEVGRQTPCPREASGTPPTAKTEPSQGACRSGDRRPSANAKRERSGLKVDRLRGPTPENVAMERRKASALASSGRVPQGTLYDVAPFRRSIDPFSLRRERNDRKITCLPAHGRKRGRRSFVFLCGRERPGCLTSEKFNKLGVMAGLIPATPISRAQCPPERDGRHISAFTHSPRRRAWTPWCSSTRHAPAMTKERLSFVCATPSALILRSDHIADVIASRRMARASWFETGAFAPRRPVVPPVPKAEAAARRARSPA